jgi:hypothetical protein
VCITSVHHQEKVSQEKQLTAREINLARALYRLGDQDGKAAAILKRYAADPRGFYANYARMVLAEKQPAP